MTAELNASGKTYNKPFAGCRALITGSTHGIGRATALMLAEKGSDVVINFSKHPDDSLVDDIQKLGVRCLAVKADMSVRDDCIHLIKEGVDFLGGLDFLVCNAGPFKMGKVADMPADDMEFMIAGNLAAGLHLTREAIPSLRKSPRAAIVYIGGTASSIIASRPSISTYAASKSALATVMRTVAVEEGPNGIRANMVSPGYIDSGNYSDDFRIRGAKEVPLRRLGKPDDIARCVCWLLSDDASYISGAIIDVGGALWL